MTADRFTLTALRGNRAWWLLEVEAFGQVLRLATADLFVEESATSQTHHYVGTLPGAAFADAVEVLQDNIDAGGLTIECVLPVDVPALKAAGHRLEGARATLSRWIEGTDYSERRKALVGRVRGSETGAHHEPVSFTVAEPIWEQSTLIPPATHVVDGTNWPDSITSLVGEELGLVYPIVFGTPGVTNTSRGWVTGSQGVWVDHRRTGGTDDLKLVLAGHRVMATRVMLSTDDDVTGERFVVHHTTDGRGQTVAYVDAEASIGVGYSTTDGDSVVAYGLGHGSIDNSYQPQDATVAVEFKPVFVSWYCPIGAAPEISGGMRGRSGALVRSAGDVLEALFGFLDRPIDWGRFAAAKPLLSRFKIDAMIDARVRPWDWFTANLRPILPVSMVAGPHGLYPIVWRFDATASDAVAHIDTSTDYAIERASRLQTDTSNVRNDFSLKYGLSIRTGQYHRTVYLGAGPYDSATPAHHVSLHCLQSQRRFRTADGKPRVVADELESACIYDDATAAAILSWRARAYALGQTTVDYVLPESEWGWLERGMAITLTDADLHLAKQVCMVVETQIDDSDTMGIRLLILEDPARDGRAA